MKKIVSFVIATPFLIVSLPLMFVAVCVGWCAAKVVRAGDRAIAYWQS